MTEFTLKRILLIDDNASIHEDFRKILINRTDSSQLESARNKLFNKSDDTEDELLLEKLQIDSAYQGQEGLDMVEIAKAEGRPYALAFVDIRMPPGWDGILTIQKIWEVDKDI